MTHGLDIIKKDPQIIRIPFLDETDLRPGQEGIFTKDKFFLNGYFEPVKSPLTSEIELHFTKRPGTTRSQNTGNVSGGRRIYFWTANNTLHVITNSAIWKSGTGDLGVTLLAVSQTHIGIAETRPGATTQYLGINTGDALTLVNTSGNVIVLNGVAITSSSVANPTTITTSGAHGLNTGNQIIIRNHVGSTPSINDTIFPITKTGTNTFTIPVNVTVGGSGGTIGTFPRNTDGSLVYMDGYWFVQDSQARIWNCAVDDPTTWSITSFINAQMLPGRPGITRGGLARQNNFLVAFSDRHFQLFVDAANPVGSPLANVEQAEQQIGCWDSKSIAFTENTLYWVSNTYSGGISVYRLDGTTNLKDIASPTVKRILQQTNTADSPFYRGYILRYAGHIFYVLNMTSDNINATYIYDQNLDIWYQWSDTSGTNIFPFADITQNTFGGTAATRADMIHTTDGWVYTLNQNVFQDNSVNFPVVIQTNTLTFGTMARKFYDKAELIGDKQSTTANVLLSFSDDDYNSFSATRTLDMSQIRMFTRNLSNSRRRAWKISYTGNTALRLQALEFSIELDVS